LKNICAKHLSRRIGGRENIVKLKKKYTKRKKITETIMYGMSPRLPSETHFQNQLTNHFLDSLNFI
jgi:hypothetical protein